MTHDELLAKIDDRLAPPKSAGEWSMNEFAGKMLITLRAVVELHPIFMNSKDEVVCCYCFVAYPCPTIQAIEEQFKCAVIGA